MFVWALGMLVSKIGFISCNRRTRACGQLATEVMAVDAIPNRQDRGTWDKLLQGNHPPCPEREGWSQLDPIALGCSWLGGDPRCVPSGLGLLGVLL